MATKKPAAKPKAGTSKEAAAARKAKFIEAYIANGENATDAALQAGYAASSARERGYELVKDREVIAALKKRREALARKFELRTEDVLRELARIVHADPRKAFDEQGNLLPVNQWPDEVAAMIASVECDEIKGEGGVILGMTKKIKIWDKNSAIDKAMKHLGQYEKDNAQKTAFSEMSEDALDRFIERKAKEAGAQLH
jgi:phage terminase small subunit